MPLRCIVGYKLIVSLYFNVQLSNELHILLQIVFMLVKHKTAGEVART